MQLRSYLQDSWVSGDGPGRAIVDATTGAEVARASADGLDLGAALAHARAVGGPALRAMSFAERGQMLKAMSAAIHENRDALLDVSRHGGTTRSDGKFDIDGAAGTLSFYAYLSKGLGDQRFLLDGAQESVLGSKRFVAQHIWTPRQGVAIHINAFNFPAWGMAEKAATALLAGVPVLTKPATATAPVAVRIVELWVEAGVLPAGALQLLTGSAGDLLDHVGPQDVVAFTGGSDTAGAVRGHPAVLANNVRVNIEADSLNVSILGPDVQPGSDTWWMFVNDVARDMTQKAGQKCTAIRRILVPSAVADAAVEALSEKLSRSIVGDPGDKDTAVGPVASPSQRDTVARGLAALGEHCAIAWQAEAIPEGGCFVRPTLFRSDAGIDTPYVHEHEVFGPAATVLPWAEYFEKSGYARNGQYYEKGGKVLEVDFKSTAGNNLRLKVAQLLQQRLKSNGIKMNIALEPPNVYFGQTTVQGNYHVGLWAWSSGIDPSQETMFPCDQIPSEANEFSGQNNYRYCNETVSALIAKGNVTTDVAERVKITHEIQRLMAADMPLLPMFQRPETLAYTDRLQGMDNNPLGGLVWNAADWAVVQQ